LLLLLLGGWAVYEAISQVQRSLLLFLLLWPTVCVIERLRLTHFIN